MIARRKKTKPSGREVVGEALAGILWRRERAGSDSESAGKKTESADPEFYFAETSSAYTLRGASKFTGT